MKRRNKKLLSLLLSVLLLVSMIVPASAANTEELSAASFTAEELAFFEAQGIDFDKIVGISYEEATVSVTNADSKTRSTTIETVDVLQFNMVDGDIVTSTSIMFTAENGAPTSVRATGSMGSSSSDLIHYVVATVQYMYYNINGVVYLNPYSVTLRPTVACTGVTVYYRAYGNLHNMTGTSPVLIQQGVDANIANYFSNMVANVSYTSYGGYNNYSLPVGQAIELVGTGGNGAPHIVNANYTANGYYYTANFPFLNPGL
ncbi:MAG: hypothetical protein E7449_06840 [Ruminococcaceae bacterium]|nr:hypothetical protein [Oscillospiraceae bacterium]